MNTQSEHGQGWEDIIFEKRNKEYGAYTIRKNYNSNVLKAEAISIGIALLVFIVPILLPETKIIPPIIDKADRPLIIADKFKVKPDVITPPAREQHIRRTNAAVIPTQVVTHEVEEPVTKPTSDEVTYTTGPETTSGEVGPETIDEPGTGTIPVEVSNKPFDIVEIMPEYEGGQQAMMKFLQKKLHYPSRARSAGQQGTVYVRFVINADGSVSDVEVVKGFFKDCDEEAVRVVSMMNKWKPGIQGNMRVAVRKVLPITFRMDI